MSNRISELIALRDKALGCTSCDLHKTRTTVVFGTGNINQPPVMVVGEAPGRNEDEQGEPFVGRAGAILDRWIEWLGFKREEVYIQNTLQCRPPNNRDPLPVERAACAPYFWNKVKLIQPQVLLTVGRIAAVNVLGLDGDMSMSHVRGSWHFIDGIPCRCTYHPAYILRSPQAETKVREDLQAVRKRLCGTGT